MVDHPAKYNRRRRGLAKDKPPTPPRPLKPLARFGKPRCQYWDMRRANHNDLKSKLVFFQCGQIARTGFPTCCYHGAGSARREKLGSRANPATAAISTGAYATQEHVDEFLVENPRFQALYRGWLNSPDLFDLKPVLALCRALLDHFVCLADLDNTASRKGSDPPILKAIAAAERVAGLMERFVVLEKKMGRVSSAEVQKFVDAFAATLNEFVPTERMEEARAYCLRRLRPDGQRPMGRGPIATLGH